MVSFNINKVDNYTEPTIETVNIEVELSCSCGCSVFSGSGSGW